MESNCPFCDRSKFEERLVGSIGSFNVIATLGQISEGGYLLLVSKEHAPCLGAMPNTRELAGAIAHLQAVFLKEYATPHVTLFEHGIVGQTVFHAHLHLVPEAVAIGARVRKDFPDHSFEEFADVHTFRFGYAIEQKPYLLWQEPNGKLSVCWNPPAPPQYLRIVVAEALGKPERANWRTMDPVLDRKLWTETVTRLRVYIPQGA
ncbi:MAG: hypothetical protein Q7S52_02765 [bacterium]|nr:hypothetical protein [bacterium]